MIEVQVLYFASLRDALGSEGETVELDDGATVADLLATLRARGSAFAAALAPDKPVRAAVDQEFAGSEATLRDGTEVGLFPPVTGG